MGLNNKMHYWKEKVKKVLVKMFKFLSLKEIKAF